MDKKYELLATLDGSHTLKLEGSNITFHSNKGAVQESLHIFIHAGFRYFINSYPNKNEVSIFEVGFGTGLNTLLTAIEARTNEKQVFYHTIDKFPVPKQVYSLLNYPEILNQNELFINVMQLDWEKQLTISPFFQLKKIQRDFTDYDICEVYDIIYFDAFAPDDQEEMWTEDICRKCFKSLNVGGILVTYCSKSIVRKRLQNVGFGVQKLPGPLGKREIIRAIKNN